MHIRRFSGAILYLLISGALLSSCTPRQEQAPDKTKQLTMEKEMRHDTNDMSCKLTSPELQERKQTVIAELKKKALERREIQNGLAFRFEASDETIEQVSEFIRTERQCCGFFDFTMKIRNNGSLWLGITGDERAKEFITAELNL
jgi:hypothetical protein